MLKISNVRVYGLEESIVASGYPMLTKPLTTGEFEYEAADLDSFINNEPFEACSTNKALKNVQRACKLGSVPSGTGHDNFLRGIIVQYDVRYPVYWTPQFQRYSGYNNIISSQSAMHRLVKMDLNESMNEYVLPEIKEMIKELIFIYNSAIQNKIPIYSYELIVDDNLYFTMDKDEILESEYYLENSLKEVSLEKLYMYIISNCPQGLEKTMRVSTNYLQLKTMWNQRRNHKLKDWQVFCDEIEKLPYFKELTGCGL